MATARKILFISLLMTLILFAFGGVCSAEGEWTYEAWDGAGWMITGYTGSSTDLVIPDTIEDIPVTCIGKKAFANNSTITSITIPKSITAIKAEAFYKCSRLSLINFNAKNCTIPDIWIYDGNKGAGVFSGAGSLTSSGIRVVFGSTVEKVPDKLFETASLDAYGQKGYDYAHVSSVEFSSKVKEIGNFAFGNCADLETVVLGSNITSIGTYAFRGCTSLVSLEVNDELITLQEGAFLNCTSLEDITWGLSLDSIGVSAFAGCTSLKTVHVPSPVTVLHRSAFSGCTGLRTVSLPKSLRTLSGEAFRDCKKLTSLTINSAELTVPDVWIYDSAKGVGVFSGAGALIDGGFTVTFGSSVKYIPAHLFQTACYDDYSGLDVDTYGRNGYDYAHVGSVQMSSSITEIGEYAFIGCQDLAEVTLGSSTVKVGTHAFWGCTNLTSLAASALETVDSYAFRYCSALTDIDWGSAIDTVGSFAFANCTALKTLVLPKPAVTVSGSAFAYCSALNSVTLPESLTHLGGEAFRDCKKLTSLTINSAELTVPDVWIYDSAKGAGVFSGAGAQIEDGFAVVFGPSVKYVPAHLFQTACYDDYSGLDVDTYGRSGYDYAHVGSVQMSAGIAEIGEYAFIGCQELDSVALGSSTTKIGTHAFWGCRELASLTGSVLETVDSYAFRYCTSLSSIAWGRAIRTINAFAFADCTSIKSLPLPGTLTDIGANAFAGCTGVKTLTLPRSLKNLGGQAFCGCTGLERITVNSTDLTAATPWIYDGNRGAGVFSGAGAASENGLIVSFGSGVTKIPDGLFSTASRTDYGMKGYDYAHVTYVFIPENVTVIGGEAFRNCKKLTTISLPHSSSASLTIGANAFCSDAAISTKLYIGDASDLHAAVAGYDFSGQNRSVTFISCGRKADLPDDLTAVEDQAFCGALIETAVFPGTVDSIGARAFADCRNLHLVYIPASLTDIAEDAFANCPNVVLVCRGENAAAANYAARHNLTYVVHQ